MFRMKSKVLLKYFKDDGPFGHTTKFMSVIEFQKRGLAHTHITIFLDQAAKFSLQDSNNIDKLISAEVPVTSTHLCELVLKHMIHYPCTEDPVV